MYSPNSWPHKTFEDVLALLKGLHGYNFYATLLTIDDQFVLRLPPILTGSGSQINHVAPGMTCTVSVGDPDRSLAHFEGAHARKYLIRVYCELPESGLPVDPWEVGTFAVQSVAREDWKLTFSGVSKVMLAQFRPLDPFTVPAGVKISEAILRIMEASGEARSLMNIPDSPRTLKHPVVVAPASPDDDPTTAPHTFIVIARGLGTELGLDLLYRPPGTFLGRKSTKKPVFTFDPSWLVSAPKETGDFSSFHNVITGLWGKNLNEKPVQVRPPAKHQLSAESLARRGVPFTQEKVLEFPNARHVDAVTAMCHQALRAELEDALTDQATIFPFPFLEPGDYVTLKGSTFAPSWTLSLDVGLPMSLNWQRFAFLGPLP